MQYPEKCRSFEEEELMHQVRELLNKHVCMCNHSKKLRACRLRKMHVLENTKVLCQPNDKIEQLKLATNWQTQTQTTIMHFPSNKYFIIRFVKQY